ncbi:hypothetical protein Tco_0534661 [Tanacetum coccineum]
MVEMQKPSKDKYGLGYTKDIASTSTNKIKNLGPQIDEMLFVEPATPVPSATEPACSDEQNRLSAAKTENAKKAKILGSNIVKKNDSILITRKPTLSLPKSNKQLPILKLGQGHRKNRIQTLHKTAHGRPNVLYPKSNYHQVGWNYGTQQEQQFHSPMYNQWGPFPPFLYMGQPNVNLEPDEWIKDSGCTKHMTGSKDLFSSYKAIDGDASQTSGGDEGLLDLYALNREVRRLKKQTISQAKQIRKLKAKLKKLSKRVQPVVKHHAFWVESQNLKKQKRRRKKQRKKVSSVKLGRNKDASNLSEENNDHDQDDHTAFVYEDFDATAFVTPDLERKNDETEERKSDETEEVLIEEEKDASDVKSGDTEELDLEKIQSTARQSTVTPRTLDFDDEAGPSSPIRPTQEEEPEEQFKDDELLADILLNRTRGLSIPGPMQSQPQQPTQATDPKEKGKGILVEEPKKKKLTLQQIRALETKNDEEVARKIQAEWDAEEERKRLEALKKPKTILKKPTSLVQERNQMMSFLKGQGYKNLQKLKYPQMKELYDKVQESIKESFKDFIPMGSEKEKQMLQERDAKRLLRKRKGYSYREQHQSSLN